MKTPELAGFRVCASSLRVSPPLAVSLPTMLVGFARYSRDQNFAVLGQNRVFLLVMAAGSIVGTFIGGRLLGLCPTISCCLCWQRSC